MPALAITGNIGSGKSHVLDSLAEILRAERFCADEANRRLLDEDARIRKLIVSRFGSSCYRSDGTADRKKIFELIRADNHSRSELENILHPRLEEIWKPKAEQFRKIRDSFFVAEIPLLYEKNLQCFFDKTIVVGCSDALRRKRLLEFRLLKAEETEDWSGMQDAQASKIVKADHILWNDGSQSMLQRQIHLLASQLQQS